MDPEYCWHTYASLSQSAAIGFCSEAIRIEGVTNHPKPLSVANVWTEDLESIRGGRLWGLDPKICRRGQSMFWSPKMSHSFIQNCCWITLQVFASSKMKDLCQKWKVKLIFWAAYRLPGTGIVECLEIIDVGCNMKQFAGLTWLTLSPNIIRQIYTTGQHSCEVRTLLTLNWWK